MSEEEDQELLEFQKIDGIPRRVKERAEIIRLNHHGWTVSAIAKRSAKRGANGLFRLNKKVQDRRGERSQKVRYYFNIKACLKRLNTPAEQKSK